ncbi:PREDICTED: uncharacterized protein LOC104804993 [Tarenaya hassleriana]|uniref:uncharacterized protein LOC104804993 n=1 Tax=Tarenaya hassleriana TaxID=28532 RepID=UPI00053C83A8|nr:PREDICTED: uncharacterized protein LOC104804993 [Tarenaya hassleriana]
MDKSPTRNGHTQAKKPISNSFVKNENKAKAKDSDARDKGEPIINSTKTTTIGNTTFSSCTNHIREVMCYKCKDRGHIAHECPNQREIIIEDDGESKSIVEVVVNLEEKYEVMSKKVTEYVNEEKEEPVEDPDLVTKEVPTSVVNANEEMHDVKKDAFGVKNIIEDSNNKKATESNDEANKSENVIVGENLDKVKWDIGMIRLDWFEQIEVTSKKENTGFKVVSKPSAMTNDTTNNRTCIISQKIGATVNFIPIFIIVYDSCVDEYVVQLEQQMRTFQTITSIKISRDVPTTLTRLLFYILLIVRKYYILMKGSKKCKKKQLRAFFKLKFCMS